MALQEAINRLKNICFTVKNEPDEIEAAQYIGALKLAISALEKQVPEKPKMQYECTYLCPPDFGGEEFDDYGEIPHCPSCGRKLDENKYNCKCGQAIDWSEEE